MTDAAIDTDLHVDRSKMEVSDEIAIQITGMNKWFGEFHVLRGHQSHGEQGRAHRDLWPVRLGQVDADPLHQPS